MKTKSLIAKFLIATITFSSIFTIKNTNITLADSFISVTLGADLSEDQKNSMLEYFKIDKNDANILEVTSKEEYEALGDIATPAQLGTKSISCSYVEPKSSGGLDIKTNNLTWVTEGMIKNSLITAGITDAKVVAAAPFKVSGTAALTGILKGFENSSEGDKITEENKEAANEELFVTAEIGDEIGQDDATNLINDIKKDVLKEEPKTKEEVNEIVDDTINNYDYNLSDESIDKIKELMNKINDLDLDYSSIKDQLNEISDQLADKIDSDAVKGFFDKICDFFSNLWDSIVNFFTGDDEDNTSKEEPTTTEESENNSDINLDDSNSNSTNESDNNSTQSENNATNEENSSSYNDSNSNVDSDDNSTNNTDSNTDTTEDSSNIEEDLDSK